MKRFILFLSIAVFAIMALSSCTPAEKGSKDVKDVPVIILAKGKSGKRPDVVPPRVPLRFDKEQAVWFIDDDVKFKIKFNKNGTPFASAEFDSENFNNGIIESGPPVVDPGNRPRFYKYSVEVDGLEILDPEIIIWNRH